MGAAEINLDNQINDYVKLLNIQQKQAILAVAEAFVHDNSATGDAEYNDDFIAELNKRTTELENGIVKGYSWDEVKDQARASLKAKTEA